MAPLQDTMHESQQTAFFLGGVGPSGTTLVVDMLGLHSDLSPIYETDFVISFLEAVREGRLERLRAALKFAIKWAEPLPHRPHNKREHERSHHGPHYILFTRKHMAKSINTFLDGLTETNVVPKLNHLVHDLFRCHCELDKKKMWVNKTPAYVLFLPELKLTFPRMKFIHCIRDGRDVACSVVTRPWGPKTHLEAASWWKTQILKAREFAQTYPNDFIDVRYEDLVFRARTHLEKAIPVPRNRRRKRQTP